jgi:hypothetical protein
VTSSGGTLLIGSRLQTVLVNERKPRCLMEGELGQSERVRELMRCILQGENCSPCSCMELSWYGRGASIRDCRRVRALQGLEPTLFYRNSYVCTKIDKTIFVGDALQKEVAPVFDCPRFTVHVYEACILFDPNSMQGSAEESNSEDCFGSGYKF